MNGTKTPQPSMYGTLGAPASKNMPGNRSSALSWTDSKGNLWLFGGNGSDAVGNYGFLNDLWEYSPATNQWVWMGGNSALNGSMGSGIYIGAGVSGTLGTPAAGNIPEGCSDAVSWTDAKGNLWLFGGYNYGSGNSYFNDLWEFNPSTRPSLAFWWRWRRLKRRAGSAQRSLGVQIRPPISGRGWVEATPFPNAALPTAGSQEFTAR